MTDTPSTDNIDALDRDILTILQNEGRISHKELSRRVPLSAPTIHTRIKRLENEGIIKGYAALLEPESVGYDMLCFVNISLQIHQFDQVEAFRAQIQQMPEVLECYHLTGEFDYLLKVVIRNRKDLERFVVNQLTPIPGVARIYTSLVLTEVKHNTALPIPNP